jgi:hypothetical protein
MKPNSSTKIQKQTPFKLATECFFEGLLDLTVKTIIVYNHAKQEEKRLCLVTK